MSLAAGLALIDAIDTAVPDQALMLKWPNDLLLGGDKLAGILLERNSQRIVAGFGVNLASAPVISDRVAVSLGGAVGPRQFAPLLAATFARRLDQWRSDDRETLSSNWLARAHSLGTPLIVHGAGAERLAGAFAGIEADGALRLETERGMQIVRAGDVDLGE